VTTCYLKIPQGLTQLSGLQHMCSVWPYARHAKSIIVWYSCKRLMSGGGRCQELDDDRCIKKGNYEIWYLLRMNSPTPKYACSQMNCGLFFFRQASRETPPMEQLGHIFFRQASWQMPPMEQQMQVLPLLVPPKILLQWPQERGEPCKIRLSPYDHPADNIHVAKGVPNPSSN
jgi:hypothetical protein